MKAISCVSLLLLVVWICFGSCQIVDGDINHVYGRIFVGNYRAGKDIKGLIETYNVTAVLNVAWDLDIRRRSGSEIKLIIQCRYDNYMVPPGYHMLIQTNKIGSAQKVGLVDGTGNNIASLASAVYMLDQYFLTRDLEDKDNATYPLVNNVLVHCNKGQSRSVVVTALYLHYKSNKFSTFEDALNFVKSKRGLQHNSSVPEPNLLELARQLSAINIFSLFPKQ